MKTAESILRNTHEELSKPNPTDWKSFDEIMKDGTGEAVIKAMKEYASQAIDRCAESANMNYKNTFGERTCTGYINEGNGEFVSINAQSILKIKSELK